MPATTGRLQMPYPVPDDQVDVPRDIKALAEGVDPNMAVDAQGVLAARPAPGVRGRYYWATDHKVLLRDDGTAWTLVRAPTLSSSALAQVVPGTAITAAGDGPRLTIPFAGVWRLEHGALCSNRQMNAAGQVLVHLYAGASVATSDHALQFGFPATTGAIGILATCARVAKPDPTLNAGTVVEQRYSAFAAGIGAVSSRWLEATALALA
jgi:hypothetical protein